MTIDVSGGGGGVADVPLAGNDSSTALNTGSSFTGSWSAVPVGSLLTVDLKSDVDLTLKVEYSVDGGTTTDSTLTRYYRTAFIFAPQTFKNARPYVRLVVENSSGTNATYMRLNSYVGEGEAILNIPVDGTMSKDYGAISTRPTDFHAEVALGRRQGVSLWNKFGYNDDVDTGTELLASWGGTFQFLTTGETINIVSTSTADDGDPAGTGVNSIVVYGVDENWDSQTVVYTMDGTSTVTSAESWIGINRVASFLSGSGQTNAGTINITATTSGYQMAQMPAGEGVSQQCIFYTPQNHTFLAEWLHFNSIKLSGGGNPELIFKAWVYSAVNNTKQEVFRGKMDLARSNDLDVAPPVPFPLSEKTIFWLECTTDSDNTQASARFSGELARDADA